MKHPRRQLIRTIRSQTLARVDHEDAFCMFDYESVERSPLLRPLTIGEAGKLALEFARNPAGIHSEPSSFATIT